MSDPTGRLLAVDRKFVFPSSFPFAKLTSDNEIDRRQRRGQLRANVKSSRHVHGASDPVCAECIRGGLGLGTISSHAPSLAHSFMGAQTPFCRTIPSATRTAHSTVALCWGAIMGHQHSGACRLSPSCTMLDCLRGNDGSLLSHPWSPGRHKPAPQFRVGASRVASVKRGRDGAAGCSAQGTSPRFLPALSTLREVAPSPLCRQNPIYDEAYNAVIAIPMPTFWPTIEI
ncbi:hypothetical protein V497_03908 [Pseudogymnoascus sp. VKM F-4516 (FW-969)]|nr:hypothetical protein V497_03908 [Pseudogymnoascus sp. VKM F-4516 (FW-969)]